MPLQPVQLSEAASATQVAQGIIHQIGLLADRIDAIRVNGIPAVGAQEAQVINGRPVPARPARAAISSEAINEALGADNCVLLDSLKAAIKGS